MLFARGLLLPLPAPPQTQALKSTTFKPPPLDGSLTLPELYDWHYYNTPEHPIFVYPNVTDQPRVVKWPEAVRAFTRGARLIQNLTGLEHKDTDNIVGIFAASDTITYFTLIAATVKAGFVPFLISPRNSPAAVAHLLSVTHTAHVLVGVEAALHSVFEAALKLLHDKDPRLPLPAQSPTPTFDDLYIVDETYVPLPLHKPDLNSLAVLLHSSDFGSRDLTGVRLSCHAMPMFHGMGMMQTVWTASIGITITAARPQVPPVQPTPDNVLSSSKATQTDLICCVPAFIEAWSRSQDTIKFLSSIDGIVFGGGPLNKAVGDSLIRHGVDLFTLYGCTEIGIMSPMLPGSADLDWEYLTFSGNLRSILIPNGYSQHELVILPNPYAIPCVINGKYDGMDAYYTGDLFVAHPSKPGYYKIFGRVDDQIMHSTGEKTNPGPLENILNQDPRVQSAVMFGRGKFNVGVLIDLRAEYKFEPSDAVKLAEFRNVIWPAIERMNAYAPQHSRVFKEMILVASASKPFDYTAKNTPRRQSVLSKYTAEIEALYQSVEETSQLEVVPPSVWKGNEVRDFVARVAQKVMNADLLDDQDLFQHGCDSLQATWIRNTLSRAIRDSTKLNTNAIPENLVYQYPTISKLSTFAVRFVSRANSGALDEDDLELAAQNMKDMVETYSANFPARRTQSSAETSTSGVGEVFLVTGTTGSLGASLLADILKASSTSKVFALNRPGRGTSTLVERQTTALKTIGLDPSDVMSSSRLVLVEADMADANAGLTSVLGEEIRASVTHIILNAWPVDFNLSLQSFEPSVKAVRNLIDVALSSSLHSPPKITFVSSIGVLSRHQGGSSVLEAPVSPALAEGTGYSQSKWVAESILLNAAAATSLSVAVVRVGQISGGANGYWRKSDWLPSIVKSSRALNCFPNFGQDKIMSWIPLQSASQVLLELATSPSETGQVFHLVHPRPVSASLVSQTLAGKLGVPLVPYPEWLDALESRAQGEVDGSDLHAIPALRLLRFFRFVKISSSTGSGEALGLPSLDTLYTRKSSSTFLRNMIAIDQAGVERWVNTWISGGFL
ncbi:hypothetical protein ONZ45_g10995 [Pleurotus djamor]|nr:hypothetical protein ONZ45_g10995 [Pleurotus djamor]